MAVRTRLSPGTEIHEIDRSQYNSKNDYSIVNTATLVCGFADKGEDYNTQWINSKQTLVDTYGYPTTEFERYFYNAGSEILNRGGVLLMAKIPYDNDSCNKFAVCDYTVSVDLPISSSPYCDDLKEVDTSIQHYALIGNLIHNKQIDINIDIVNDFRNAVKTIADEFNQEYVIDDIYDIYDAILSLELIVGDPQTLDSLEDMRKKCYDIVEYINANGGSRMVFADDKLISLSSLDQLLTSTQTLQKNTIKIVDITRAKYQCTNIVSSDLTSTTLVEKDCECLGIMPLIVSPINALLYSGIIQNLNNISAYEPVENIRRRKDRISINYTLGITAEEYSTNFVVPFTSSGSQFDTTLSEIASRYFPDITYNDNNYLSRSNLKQIGVVVFKVYRDFANDNKINYAPLESFIGSFDKTAVDSSGKSIYIDNIINSQSQYIKFFSNVSIPENVDIIAVNDQIGTVLGFTSKETAKNISLQTILTSLDVILEKDKDVNNLNIDIVADAGITTIAQCVNDIKQQNPVEALSNIIDNDSWFDSWKLESKQNSMAWYAIASKFDNFCKAMRKDCMFISDGLRTFSLDSSLKIVRSTDLASSIERSLVPKLLSHMTLNSSYSAGYIDWFQQADSYSGQLFWCPPSIKAAGIYTYTDAYFHTWDAPAGMTRGIVPDATDVSFNPFGDEAGRIYAANWNYAKSYPEDGIVVEGQKTFQKTPSALDRVNVRRLLLSLEKKTRNASRYFKYEENSEYLRSRFVDMIRPIFDDAVDGRGISEYAILCDESNNPPEAIDNHELHCRIAVKPIKTIEWIVIDFICTNQSTTVVEEVRR